MFGRKKREMTVTIQFSSKQIIKFLLAALVIFLIIKLQHVILLLFLSFILMTALKPAASILKRYLHIPEPLAIFIVYIVLFVIIGFSIYFISKPFTNEFNNLSQNAASIIDSLSKKFPFLAGKFNGSSPEEALKNLFTGLSNEFSNLGSTISNALNFTVSAFGILLEIITVIIISIYLFLDREKLFQFFIDVLRLDKKKFYSVYDKVEVQLGAWVRGQLILGVIVGFMTWVGLVILGIKFALPLAVLAGILEIIPIIGPIIAAVPIAIIGFSVSITTGVLTLGLSTLIQQLENNLLVPGVMKKAVGLSPIVTLTSVLIGSKLLGIIGAILAVPVAAMVSVLINAYLEERSDNSLTEE
jgi:predicted PurR-regulated permease PerM